MPNSNESNYLAHQKSIQNMGDLETICKNYHLEEKRIVFTSGMFDILQEGHINFLSDAKQFGDVLIVALHTDESIQNIRGQEYPMHSLSERTRILTALSDVDLVISFSGQYPLEAIQFVRPQVYIKGENFDYQNSPEVEAVEKHGGEVMILPFRANPVFLEDENIYDRRWRVPPFFWSYISL